MNEKLKKDLELVKKIIGGVVGRLIISLGLSFPIPFLFNVSSDEEGFILWGIFAVIFYLALTLLKRYNIWGIDNSGNKSH